MKRGLIITLVFFLALLILFLNGNGCNEGVIENEEQCIAAGYYCGNNSLLGGCGNEEEVGLCQKSVPCCKKITSYICGNSICESNESSITCCKDCGCQGNYTCINNSCIQNIPQNNTNQTNKTKFCGDLTLNEIINIANQSACIENGTINITKEKSCNNYTNTAWLGLVPFEENSLCNPACVVNVITEQAEINWRCTGLNPEPEEFTIKTDKNSYSIGEEVKVISNSSLTVYEERNYARPYIYKKVDDEWQSFNSSFYCTQTCERANETCDYLACGARPTCTEVNNQEIWIWNQAYAGFDNINCSFQSTPRTIFCYNPFTAIQGTYKIEFIYYEQCREDDWPLEEYKESAFTNEFTIA